MEVVAASIRRPGKTCLHSQQISAESRLDREEALQLTVDDHRYDEVTATRCKVEEGEDETGGERRCNAVRSSVRSGRFWLNHGTLAALMTPFSAAIEALGGDSMTLADVIRWVLTLDEHMIEMQTNLSLVGQTKCSTTR